MGDVQAQLNALNAHDLPFALTESDVAFLNAKVQSVDRNDAIYTW